MQIKLTEFPTEKDWLEVKRRALVTVGLKTKTEPDISWKIKILRARHSPIRRLRFSFDLEVPYFVSVHLARHIHAQPYIKTQRNDRQAGYNRNEAPQDYPVNMIWDITGEEMLIIANKRLCSCADPTTRFIVSEMCKLICQTNPEFTEFLVPMCGYLHSCPEFKSCGAYKKYINEGVTSFHENKKQ